MLKKILKYDLLDIYKILIVFYSLAIIFSIFTRIFLNIESSAILNIVGQICSGITISMMISIIINNLMRIWHRFLSNIYKDESYLTHTLPVTKKNIYLSKFLSLIITMLTSALIIALSLFIAYYSKENIAIIKNLLLPLENVYNSTIIKILSIFLLVFFIEMIFIVQIGYTGIILGHKKNNNKLPLSIIYGFAIYFLTQASILLILFIIGLFNQEIMNLFITNEIVNISIIKTTMYISITIYTVYIIINYIINIKLFNKGVNVE